MRRTIDAITLGVVLALFGCGAGGAANAPLDAPPISGDENDELARRMAEVAARLDEAGLTRGQLEGRGFLPARGSATHALEVPAGECLTLTVLASQGVRDIDAYLYAPSGELLAEDIEPDAHPTLQMCGGEQGRSVYYHLQAFEGAGAYLFASFDGDARSFPAAALIIGGQPGVADLTGQDADPRLQDLERGLAQRGFVPRGESKLVPVRAGEPVLVPLPVEVGRCYTVATFTTGQSPVRLRVLDDLSEVVAEGTQVGGEPTGETHTQLCTQRDADFLVELRTGGNAEVTVAIFEARDAEAGGVGNLWLGRRRRELRVRATEVEDNAARVQQALRQLGASGRRVWHGRLIAGEARRVALEPSETCKLVVALGGQGTGRLGLRLLDEGGSPLTHAERGSVVAASTCARADAHLVLRGGVGEAELLVASVGEPKARRTPSGEASVAQRAMEPVPEALRTGVLDARFEAQLEGRRIERDEIVSVPGRVQVPSDGCYAVRVTGPVPLRLRIGDVERARSTSARVGVCEGATIDVRTLEVAQSGAQATQAHVLITRR